MWRKQQGCLIGVLLLNLATTAWGHVEIPSLIQKKAAIQTAVAGSATLKHYLTVVGKIATNRDTLVPIYPRYAGIVKHLTKNLGDSVRKGEVLVRIESNESLQDYDILAPANGTIVKKDAIVGELAKGDKSLYEVADLNTVWADLTLYRKEAPIVKRGMLVTVVGDEGKPQSISTIHYLSPFGMEDSQTSFARAVLNNSSHTWLPGMYINASILLQEKKVAVAVLEDAIQYLEKKPVVFVQRGKTFHPVPIRLGIQDGQRVEVCRGLEPGEIYVSHNSFLLKAELEKENLPLDH